MRKISSLSAVVIVLTVSLLVNPNATANGVAAEEQWQEYLRYSMFQDKPISTADDVIYLEMPAQAEDPTVVPVSIYAMMPQTPERYIKKITLLIDNNPIPQAGTFHFTPQSGRADLSMRVRIAQNTPVRAIAELSDGSLHMARRFIKASGGCSAPLGPDLEKAMTQLGKMKLRIGSVAEPDKPLSAKLRISHPNITGMQVDSGSTEYVPPRFVQSVKISYAGEIIFAAETNISISADPTFGFYFTPSVEGEMMAEITDSHGESFTKTIAVAGGKIVQ